METHFSIRDIRHRIIEERKGGKSIGFLPTMGALHKGHLALMERAKSENDLTVCSIFVNPTQFDKPEDLAKYPRTLETDQTMLKSVGCDCVFAPSPEEMYEALPKMKFDFGNLEHVMEGRFRKGHFNGVAIVVSKLFHIVTPDKAYFGLKDLQQVAVINRLIQDLNFQVELVSCPIVREDDGLAMSSRNRRLSPEARAKAPHLFGILTQAKARLMADERPRKVKNWAETAFKALPEFELEYFEIVNYESLESIDLRQPEGKNALCVAAYLDGVRLIDNLIC